jgi:hypothetical protein
MPIIITYHVHNKKNFKGLEKHMNAKHKQGSLSSYRQRRIPSKTKLKIQVFWVVTPHRLVTTDVSEYLSASICKL